MQQAVTEILEAILREYPEGAHANSVEELIEKMIEEEGINLWGGYEQIIVTGEAINKNIGIKIHVFKEA